MINFKTETFAATGHEDVKIERIPRGVLNEIGLAYFLAWYDVRHRYTRSIIGPFWITLQTAIFVACIGFVFSAISNVSTKEFIPYFAVSFVVWQFLSGSINDSTTTLLGMGGFIKDRGLPAYIFYIQSYFRNLLFLAHNAAVPILLFLMYGGASVTGLVLALPGLVLFALVVLCLSITTGVLATRYRDVKPIIESLVNLAFLASPIMWKPDVVEGRQYVLDYNPVVHLLAIWREPLLGGVVSWNNVFVSLGIALFAAAAAMLAIKNLRNAAFWI